MEDMWRDEVKRFAVGKDLLRVLQMEEVKTESQVVCRMSWTGCASSAPISMLILCVAFVDQRIFSR